MGAPAGQWGDGADAKHGFAEEQRPTRVCGLPIAVVSVCLLVVQTSGATIVTRLSRIQQGPRYLVSVAVLLTELVKLGSCVAVVAAQALRRRLARRGRAPPLASRAQLGAQAAAYARDSVPMLFPALLFTVQSQLNLFAATGLDAVSFQVTNQLKILPTAFFSALYLRRQLTTRQWVSLPALALGVAIVNSATNGGTDTHGAERFGADWWLGLAAAVAAAVLSGYAGVYCERLLKTGTGGAGGAAEGGHPSAASKGGAEGCAKGADGRSAGLEASRRASASARCGECAERGACCAACAGAAAGRAAPRSPPRTPRLTLARLSLPRLVRPVPRLPLLTLNIQLSAWGAALAGAQVAAQHGFSAQPDGPGPMHGFGGYAWAVVFLQALGGLVVSMVILHTDNVIKGFALAVSILLSWLLSIPLFGLRPTPPFVLGLALVLASVLLFTGSKPHAAGGNNAAGGQQGAPRRRVSAGERDARPALTWLEGDNVVLAALLTGVAVGLTAGVLWHSMLGGGPGWGPATPLATLR